MTPLQIYLFAYNLLQVLGWGIILLKTLYGLLNGATNLELYNNTQVELLLFQSAAILEVLHALLGFVRSPASTTAMQVYSRVSVVWLVLYKVFSARSSVGVPLVLTAWSITEVIRYSFYALSLLNAASKTLVFLRYTLFVVLYPMGAIGELCCVFAALPEVAAKKHFTVEMPNPANIAFSFWWYLIAFSLLYLPVFPQLYFYMFAQRNKVLYTEASKKRE